MRPRVSNNQNNRGQNHSQNSNADYDIKKWVANGIDSEFIKKANDLGELLNKPFGDDQNDNGLKKKNEKNALTTSQIRNIFGEMRRIQMNGYKKEKAAFLLLKPKLAYAVKRNENMGIKIFKDIFYSGYDAIDKGNDDIGAKQFENFINIIEAILAYHKYYGGKD